MAPARSYFTAAPLERAAARRQDAAWLDAAICQRATRLLPVFDGRLPLRRGQRVPALGWLPADALGPHEHRVFLGLENGAARFAVSVTAAQGDALAQAHGLEFRGLRTVAGLLDAAQAGVGAYARALDLWHRAHGFCGACGARTRSEAGGFRRCCEACGRAHFPRIDPAVIVSVRHGERCLLGRQPGWPPARYSVLAGFVEPGETLEAAVAREVEEESGVRVDQVRYQGSQPWPFPSSLMLGFTARARSTRIVLDDELEDARWFTPGEVIQGLDGGHLLLPPPQSISRFLIDEWLREAASGRAAGGERPPGP